MANPTTDNGGPVFVATYVEALPNGVDMALDVLRQIRDVHRAAAGNFRCDLLERLAQPSHFVLLDAWQNEGAATQPAAPLAEQLQPLLLSPRDVRSHGGFAVGPGDDPPAESLPAATVYAVTHVDVVPPRKDEGVALLAQLAEPSRNEDGNMGFEVWQQTGRPNHLTVVETWRDRAALDAHAMREPVRRFRQRLTPLSGALYDQRLFRAVD